MPNRRLSDFEGTWQIDRHITMADGSQGRFSGEARFTRREAGALDYFEAGQLSVGGGTPMHAERRYLWTDGLEVFFDDGRPFHQVPAGGGDAIHICPPDEYRVQYDFTDWPVWRATWRVRGPRKDYAMISTFSPVG